MQLQLKVSQLEEALEQDQEPVAVYGVAAAQGPAAAAAQRPVPDRAALDAEWESVQKLHAQVAALKMDLEVSAAGALPSWVPEFW